MTKIVSTYRIKSNGGSIPMDDLASMVMNIEINGILKPIIVDDQYNIIDGHCRHLAALILKLKNIPIIQIGINNGDVFLDAIWKKIMV